MSRLQHGVCPIRGAGWFYRPAALVGTLTRLCHPSGKEVGQAAAAVSLLLGLLPLSRPVSSSKSSHSSVVLSEDAVLPAESWVNSVLSWWERQSVASSGTLIPPPSVPRANLEVKVPSSFFPLGLPFCSFCQGHPISHAVVSDSFGRYESRHQSPPSSSTLGFCGCSVL